VFICGGNTFYPGFADRVFTDLRAIRPVNEEIVVTLSKDRVLDAWKGAAKLASSKNFGSCIITKKLYEEQGHDYLKEHCASNSFVDLRPYANTQS
jgi:actin-related protein 5